MNEHGSKLIAISLVISLVSCSTPSDTGQVAPEQIAETMVAETAKAQEIEPSFTDTPTQIPASPTTTETVTPSPTPPPPTATPGPVVYHDDFSEDVGAWLFCDVCEWKNGALYVGPYSARNELPASITLCGACGEASYFRMSVDATYEEGYVDRGYGFEIGLGSDRTLRFVITTIQVYAVVEFEGEGVGELLAVEESGHLYPSRATNRIELLVEPTGSPGTATITFRINDKSVYTLYNQRVEPAGVGLVITYHALGIAFDNFEFEALGPPSSYRVPALLNRGPQSTPTPKPATTALQPIEGQQIWFAPNMRPESGKIPYDIYSIFESDAAWEIARNNVHMIQFDQWDFLRTQPGRSPVEDPGIRERVDFSKQEGIDFAIKSDSLVDYDVGEIGKDYATKCDGSKFAEVALKNIKRIYEHDGEVTYIVLDTPFERNSRTGHANDCNLTYEEVSRELLAFMRNIHSKYPEVRFGLREYTKCYAVGNYPGRCGTNRGDLRDIFDTFLKIVSEGGERIEVFHAIAPYDWNQQYPGSEEWLKLKLLQDHIQDAGLRFGLVYTSVLGGGLSDQLFYRDVLMAKVMFESVGGDPDDFIIESWMDYPKKWLPEDEPYTFTYLLKDFISLSRAEITEKLEEEMSE